MTDADATASHYGRPNLGETIIAALERAGKDIDHLTLDDLAPIDEFHTRGRAATVDLARLAAIGPGDRVLDLGCGVGGPSRYLAKTFGCRVVGLDLTPEFCEAAEMLTRRTGLSDRVEFCQGNALAMPFEDASFDVVWTQNVVMNIADRDRLYREVHRVLKPGGRFGFAEMVSKGAGELHYPQPWARDPAQSFLLTAEATQAKLAEAELRVTEFEDVTALALTQQMARLDQAQQPDALGVHLLLGPDGRTILANSVRGLREGVIALIQGVAVREG
jgi:ubiquinone/menaquinone biosynthesis C-methylase UbiE